MEGPDRCLWFCESGASKIGRLDPTHYLFTEFALPTPNATPIGITRRRRQYVVLPKKSANKIGRITLPGRHRISVCRRRMPDRTRCRSAPTAISGSPKPKPARSAASRRTARSPNSRTASPGSKPLSIVVRDGALWFSEAAGNRVGRITMDGMVTEFPIPSHDSQPRAMVTHPDGSIWFVETSTNALGRIDRDGRIIEHKVLTPNASLRGVTVGADGDLWYTANSANKIGRMAPDGTVVGEYRYPDAGERRALHRADVGRAAVLHAMGRRPDRRSDPAVSSDKKITGGST